MRKSEGTDGLGIDVANAATTRGVNPRAFGMACTVAWTELAIALRADGHTVKDSSGPTVRKWIEGIVLDTFAAPAMNANAPVLLSDEWLDAAKKAFSGGHPEWLTRNIVRTLVVSGRVDLYEYAEWIAVYGDHEKELVEAALDAALPNVGLWIYDLDGSTGDVQRGVDAATALLSECGVTTTQALLAALVEARGGIASAPHLEAWRSASAAAIDEACKNFARIPEHVVLSKA